jgi:hypothetical protein
VRIPRLSKIPSPARDEPSSEALAGSGAGKTGVVVVFWNSNDPNAVWYLTS